MKTSKRDRLDYHFKNANVEIVTALTSLLAKQEFSNKAFFHKCPLSVFNFEDTILKHPQRVCLEYPIFLKEELVMM